MKAASLLINRMPLESFDREGNDALRSILPFVSKLNVDLISRDFLEFLPLCASLKECKIQLKAKRKR